MDIKVLPVAVKVVDQSRECPVYRKLSFGARAIFFYQGNSREQPGPSSPEPWLTFTTSFEKMSCSTLYKNEKIIYSYAKTKKDLSLRLKLDVLVMSCISVGSSLHVRGPVNEEALLPRLMQCGTSVYKWVYRAKNYPAWNRSTRRQDVVDWCMSGIHPRIAACTVTHSLHLIRQTTGSQWSLRKDCDIRGILVSDHLLVLLLRVWHGCCSGATLIY